MSPRCSGTAPRWRSDHVWSGVSSLLVTESEPTGPPDQDVTDSSLTVVIPAVKRPGASGAIGRVRAAGQAWAVEVVRATGVERVRGVAAAPVPELRPAVDPAPVEEPEPVADRRVASIGRSRRGLLVGLAGAAVLLVALLFAAGTFRGGGTGAHGPLAGHSPGGGAGVTLIPQPATPPAPVPVVPTSQPAKGYPTRTVGHAATRSTTPARPPRPGTPTGPGSHSAAPSRSNPSPAPSTSPTRTG
jgi:hypothetical protein